jgi:UPF0716 protein FxsA
MAILLLAMFIAVPIIEIGLFIEVGGWIGLWPTLGVVIATAFAGTTLLRLQGLSVLRRLQESANRNELPVQEVFDGICLLIAGILLLTPGFFTDSIGFLLFVPFFRRFAGAAVGHWLVRNGKISVSAGGFGASPGSGGPGGPGGSGRGGSARSAPGGPVIDGEFEEVDPPPRGRIEPKDGTDPKDRP